MVSCAAPAGAGGGYHQLRRFTHQENIIFHECRTRRQVTTTTKVFKWFLKMALGIFFFATGAPIIIFSFHTV